MADRNVTLNRTLAGVLALACGVAGVILCAMRGIEDQFAAGFIRVGIVLAALWCAMPSRDREAAWARVSPWAVVGGILAAVLLVRHLRVLLPIVIVLSIAGYILRPRKHRTQRPSR